MYGTVKFIQVGLSAHKIVVKSHHRRTVFSANIFCLAAKNEPKYDIATFLLISDDQSNKKLLDKHWNAE